MLVMLNVSLHHEGGQSIDYFVTNSSFGPIMVGYLDIMLAYGKPSFAPKFPTTPSTAPSTTPHDQSR